MELLAFLLMVGAGVAAYLKVVWLATESRAIRLWAIWALLGSVVLFFDAMTNTLCGMAENRSELFNERCDSGVPYIPLYGIPLLLTAPLLRHYLSGAVVFALWAIVIATAIAIPMHLFSV